jgi:hypothetical protein
MIELRDKFQPGTAAVELFERIRVKYFASLDLAYEPVIECRDTAQRNLREFADQRLALAQSERVNALIGRDIELRAALQGAREVQRAEQQQIVGRLAAECKTAAAARAPRDGVVERVMSELRPLPADLRARAPDLYQGFDEGVRPDVRAMVEQVFDDRAAWLEQAELRQALTKAFGDAKAAAAGEARKRVSAITSYAAIRDLDPVAERDAVFALVRAGIPRRFEEEAPELVAAEMAALREVVNAAVDEAMQDRQDQLQRDESMQRKHDKLKREIAARPRPPPRPRSSSPSPEPDWVPPKPKPQGPRTEDVSREVEVATTRQHKWKGFDYIGTEVTTTYSKQAGTRDVAADGAVTRQPNWTDTGNTRVEREIVQEKPPWYRRAFHHIVKAVTFGLLDV